jgi:hypothetical protein
MIRDEHIDLGVSQGIISAAQAAQLRALVTGAPTTSAISAELDAGDPDDERFRLIGGFNDIFVSIGVLLLVSALFGLTSTLGFGAGFALIAMVAAWALSEVFARRLRLALPAIALSLMFAVAGGIAAYMLVTGALQAAGLSDPEAATSPSWTLFGLGAAFAAVLHRWRFRVPIDTAIVAAGLVCAVMGGFEIADAQWTSDHRSLLLAVLGGLVFATAVYIDATDTHRLTRRSDVAFWLHLLAAPMLVQAVSSLLFGPTSELGVSQAIGILGLFAVFGLVALILDRRALLVSGMSYAGLAIGYLLSESLAKDISLSLTLLGLATLVLLLSAQWRSLRRAVLRVLPLGHLRQFVPPAS